MSKRKIKTPDEPTQLERVLHYARKHTKPPAISLAFVEASTPAEITDAANDLVARMAAFKAFQADLEELLPTTRSIEIEGVSVAVARPHPVTVGQVLASPESFPRIGQRRDYDIEKQDFTWVNPMETPVKPVNVSPIRKAMNEAYKAKRVAKSIKDKAPQS